MTNKIKRKLHIGNSIYFWVANQENLFLCPYKEFHIRVHLARNTKSLLYIDASSWYFTLSPKSVREAVEFALSSGWEPKAAGKKMYVSINGSGYYTLPPGLKYDFERQGNSVLQT
ncbi:hypothetical protein [Microbulbifer sp. VAAF005]|uniref:hypothetical protein n=1 Tax=Microbulbifer sp. VAAF005 TaxID=3034230 RepID=UPI0024AD0509|nr:hypothetical protein [Microbulbifer sp. VAAF005]WHI48030.1 hypothetical protein P0078_06515 [Microbulbifer sp. VAAF005]